MLANAILHVAVHNGTPETLTFDPKKVITVLKDLKVMVKLKTKRTTHSGLEVYPEHPSELVVDFLKAAYEKDPVKCPFDIKVINDLADEFPARKTKGSISRESRSIGGFKRDENFKDWFGNALMGQVHGLEWTCFRPCRPSFGYDGKYTETETGISGPGKWRDW